MSKKEENTVTIGAEKLITPIALILVAVIVAVIITTSGNNDEGIVDDNTDTEVEGTADYGEYTDYITDGITSSIDDDPYLGDKETAKYAIVEFSEYQCSYCYRHTSEVLPEIISELVDTGEVIYVFRDFQMYGELSEERAQAGECVFELAGVEKFVQYHEKVKEMQFVDGVEDIDVFAVADELGVDKDEVKACFDTGKYADEIAKDKTDAESIGITGTPGFVVGILNEDGSVEGSLVSGALPLEAFQLVIDNLSSKEE